MYWSSDWCSSDLHAINVILSGMVFLRLFCPAILTPISYGLLDGNVDHDFLCINSSLAEPSSDATRTLLLISKVLLASANGTEFGSQAVENGLEIGRA